MYVLADAVVLVSPPFQVRLDGASRGPNGVLCPEWVSSLDAQTPDGEDIIPASYHNRIKENSTFVYAPLRESAKSLVRTADMEGFDGLSLVFLRNLRKVEFVLVSYEGPAEVKVVQNLNHEALLQPVDLGEGQQAQQVAAQLRKVCKVVTHRCADAEVRLSKAVKIPDRGHDEKLEPIVRHYRVHEFHVALGDKGSSTTSMTLAFPLGQDRRPLSKEERKKGVGESHHTERLYCPMPVLHGGRLPFAIKADFDLTTAMLDLQPTSAWNHWVLGCVARLFVLACLSDDLLRE